MQLLSQKFVKFRWNFKIWKLSRPNAYVVSGDKKNSGSHFSNTFLKIGEWDSPEGHVFR